MRVDIYSRKAIEKLIRTKSLDQSVIISFYDPDLLAVDENYKPVDFSSINNRVFLIGLYDTDIDSLKDYKMTYDDYFSEAQELAEFICSAYDDGLNIICQCEYGESRSAGCAAAILEYFYKSGISVFVDYKYYPNKLVYHKVYNAIKNIRKTTSIE